jgi:hypothetical protein
MVTITGSGAVSFFAELLFDPDDPSPPPSVLSVDCVPGLHPTSNTANRNAIHPVHLVVFVIPNPPDQSQGDIFSPAPACMPGAIL